MEKVYEIHDNGGRPYVIIIDKNCKVKVYYNITFLNVLKADGENIEKFLEENGIHFKNETLEICCGKKSEISYYSLIEVFKPKKVFVGKSPLNKMTEFSGGYGKKFDGNTILLDMGKNEYIFIGREIIKFKSFDTIKKFLSPVGNNDVPYAYAIDESKNYYLLSNEYVVIENVGKKEPYNYYYENLKNSKEFVNLKFEVLFKEIW